MQALWQAGDPQGIQSLRLAITKATKYVHQIVNDGGRGGCRSAFNLGVAEEELDRGRSAS